MTLWTASGGGAWTNLNNWAGSNVPSSVGETAEFRFANNSGLNAVTLSQANLIFLSGLDVTLSGVFTAMTILGAAGSTSSTLRFQGSNGSPVDVRIDSTALTGSFLISGAGGLGVQLGSDTRFNVVNAGSSATISAPINGAFSLIKQGAGTLVLSGANTATGFTLIEGGTLDAASATSIASGNIAISNDAVLRTSGTLENTIETRPGASGIAGSAQIVAPTGSTLTLTGFIRHASTGTLTFGSASDTGTIVADTFGAFTAHEKSYQLAGGTLRFANANSASNLLSFPALFGTGKTSIDAGAVLDTGGFHTVIGSLDLDGGIIRSSTGALDLEVSISHATTATQNGVFQGTSSSDRVQLNVYTSLNLSQTNFVNWTTGADQIIINGLVGVGGIFTKNVEIVGSNRSDIITCAHGDDDIFGYMGIDMIDGGDGNDLITVSSAGNGSFINGGAGNDTLRILSGSVSLGSVVGFEAIDMIAGTTLTLTGTQFRAGFASNSALNGSGRIIVNMDAGVNFLAQGMSFESTVGMTVNGTSGFDVVKLGIGNSTGNIVNTGDGGSQIRGSNGVDNITGGTGNDKIMSLGGADVLTGGTGNDQFRYFFETDSGIGANADRITDFVSGSDKLNFLLMDADLATAGDQAFAFVGTGAFVGNGVGSIRYVDTGNDLRVDVDVDGDFVADMQIMLQGAGLGAGTLTAADFIL